jgi:hypothetical protein
MDFGLAALEGAHVKAVAGTPWTMSPAALSYGDDGRAGDWCGPALSFCCPCPRVAPSARHALLWRHPATRIVAWAQRL